MKTKVKTMQDLAAMFPDIYREHKLLCHAQKKAGSVVITVIDEHNHSNRNYSETYFSEKGIQ